MFLAEGVPGAPPGMATTGGVTVGEVVPKIKEKKNLEIRRGVVEK